MKFRFTQIVKKKRISTKLLIFALFLLIPYLPEINCQGLPKGPWERELREGNRNLCNIPPACGNELRGSCPTEICDDGNNISGDGCTGACQIELGWKCNHPIGQRSTCVISCGDGIIDPGETCDDGERFGGDGCNAGCQVEPLWECFGSPSVCNLITCPNSVYDIGEECDDSNNSTGDGCDNNCFVEAGWECSEFPSACNLICSNGREDPTEECDDSNVINGDGCNNNCGVEPDWECFGFPSKCNLICSNGRHNSPEECDDGNVEDDDGCTSNCEIEPGWICVEYPSICSFCGDGKVEGIETCDDGNLIPEDGCDSLCGVEKYYKCEEEPSICNITKVKPSPEVQVIGGVVSKSINIGMVVQLLLSIGMGQSLVSSWILLNTLQLIQYSSLMTLYFPKIVITFYKFLGASNFQNEYFSEIYLLHLNTTEISEQSSWDYRFLNQDIESTNILLNCSDTFFTIILLICSNCLIFLLSYLCCTHKLKKPRKKPEKCCSKFLLAIQIRLIRLKRGIFFGQVYRVIFEIFLEVLFACTYHLKSPSPLSHPYSFTITLLFLLTFTLTILSIPILYCLIPNNYDFRKGAIGVLVEGMREGKRYYMLDHVGFLVRRAIVVYAIVFQWNKGVLQNSVFLGSCILILIWKISIRPFCSKILTFQDILYEVFICMIGLTYLRFMNADEELFESGVPHICGLMIVFFIVFMMLVNFIITIYLNIAFIRLKFSSPKKKLTRIKNFRNPQKFKTDKTSLPMNSVSQPKSSKNSAAVLQKFPNKIGKNLKFRENEVEDHKFEYSQERNKSAFRWI